MAFSRVPKIVLDDVNGIAVSRTPGPLGMNDHGDPSVRARLGDTPGPLGLNDHADPNSWSADSVVANLSQSAKHLRVMTPTAGADTKLTEMDFQHAAKALGPKVSVAIIRAFAKVESGGKSGFGSNGLPVIAFEGHVFRKLTLKKHDASHPLLSYKYLEKAGREWRHNNRDNTAAWNTLSEAMRLDYEAALQSCSWGMFQVMGFNFQSCGFESIDDIVTSMKAAERGQLTAFIGYCKSRKGLVQALADKDFKTMAKLYNGNDYGNYDKLIERSYKQYGGD